MNTQDLSMEEITLKVYRYCQSLTTSTWLAEDLTQETLVKYICILEKDPFRYLNMTYLYTIARNLYIDMKRKRQEISIESYADYSVSKDFTEWDSLLEILYCTLPLKQAMLVTLKDVFLYTSKEISEMLRISDQSVKTALHRARKKLRTESNMPFSKQNTNNSWLIKKLSNSIKNKQPHKIFDYYRLLEIENYKVYCKQDYSKHVVFLSDPDGNVIQIHQNNKY